MAKNFIEFHNKQRMPIVGLGMWQADDPLEIDEAVAKALNAGYRHFDTATHYKNEAGLGRALKKVLDARSVRREDLFIVTKLPCIGMHSDRVQNFLEASLKKLQLDYVDLYLVHWPYGVKYLNNDDDLCPMTPDGKVMVDPDTNLEAVWKAMEDQVDAGRTRSIGLSNFKPSQIDRIMNIARIPPTNHQFEVHLYFQNQEWVQASHRHNITVCAYGPLGSPGRKTYANTRMNYDVPPLFEDPMVIKLATKYEKTPAQILLRFLTQLGLAVIPKSTNEERLRQNIDILDFELTANEMKNLGALDKGPEGRSFPTLPGVSDHPECPF